MRPTPVTRPSAGLRFRRSSSPPPTLRGDYKGPVFDERAWIDEILDVLAHRALLGLAAAGGCLGALLVPGKCTAAEHLSQVGPDAIEVDVLARIDGLATTLRGFEHRQELSFPDRIAGRHVQ